MKKNIFIIIAACASIGSLFCSQHGPVKLTNSEKKILNLQKFLDENKFIVNSESTLDNEARRLQIAANFTGHHNVATAALENYLKKNNLSVQKEKKQPQNNAAALLPKPKANVYLPSPVVYLDLPSPAHPDLASHFDTNSSPNHYYFQDLALYLDWKNLPPKQQGRYCNQYKARMAMIGNIVKSGWNHA